MLNIKVLGTGCVNCDKLEQIARAAVEQLSIPAEIEKVQDVASIMSYGVLATPGLVINEKLVSAGRIPSVPEVVSWLATAV